MLKAYKYRIYPTEEQKVQMTNIFGQVRFVFNIALQTKIVAYSGTKKTISSFDLCKQVTELKTEGFEWLKEAPAQALQCSLKNLDNAFNGLFKGKGFPKFKNKHGRQSFQVSQGVILKSNKKILIPKLNLVDIDLSKPLGEGKIKTCTISKTTTNKYFISILVDNERELPVKKETSENTTVGIDLGIKHLGNSIHE